MKFQSEMPETSMDRAIKFTFLGLGLVFLILFFLIENLDGGDLQNHGYWRFNLIKTHLSNELSFPYFTPARCGGFLLMADVHDLSFTPYMLLSFLIPNVIWSIKVTNFLISIFLFTGVSALMKHFGVENKNARIFAGFIVTFSGYWLYHLTWGGHIWGSGFAYLPWILVLIERIFESPIKLEKKYIKSILYLIGLFFLIINSGYWWLQVVAPVVFIRLAVEFFYPNRLKQLKKLGLILSAGLIAIILSLPRLAPIYEFQLKKFPRLGGEGISHFQVIGNTRSLIEFIWRSFFDSSLILNEIHSPKVLGFVWDYNNFIGLCTIIPIVLGLFHIKKLFKHKIFIALLLASLFQLANMRTTYLTDILRDLIPIIYKSITWYWRGTAVLVLFSGVFISCGYDMIFKKRKNIFVFLGSILMTLSFCEILNTNSNFIFEPKNNSNYYTENFPSQPLSSHYAHCDLGALFGYSNIFPPQLSIKSGASGGKSIYDSYQPGYYNMHDIRRLTSSEANGGYFLDHDWPLWPKTDSEEFEKFINFKQVVKLPAYIRILNFISGIVFVIYLFSFIAFKKL